MPASALEQLEQQYRSAGWWRNRWGQRRFREASLALLRSAAPDGLVLVGPNLGFEIPQPFSEFFEPIEFGVRDDQWQVLSGEHPTRHERVRTIALWVWGGILFVAFIPFAVSILFAQRISHVFGVLFFAFAGTTIFTLAIVWLSKILHGKWFLLPGAVAIVRGRRDGTGGVELLTRLDSLALIRWVSNGKSSTLVLELQRSDREKYRRPVTDREAISFLASWQSPLPPPAAEQVRELAT